MVGYPSNVLVVSDYEPYHWKEHVPYRIDFILSCGDNSMQCLRDLYERYKKPIFAVRGNHDGASKFPKGVIDVHLNVEEYRQWTIGGFGGTLYYKDRGHNMWNDADADYLLSYMPRCDIFICHNPTPVTDKDSYAHRGSEAIWNYINRVHPRFVYHGHTHKNAGTMVENTAIISVYGHKVVHLQAG